MLQCHEEPKSVIVFERIHANVIFLVGSLLYLPASIWDFVVERKEQDFLAHASANAATTAQQILLDDDAAAAELLYMDDAFAEFELEVQQQHWLYLFTLLLATLAYLVNGLLETKMAQDDYHREKQSLLKQYRQQQLKSLSPSKTSFSFKQLEEDDEHTNPSSSSSQHDALPHVQLPVTPTAPRIPARFKQEIFNGCLFTLAATLEFLYSIYGRSVFLLSASAHCYVANALLTLWLRRQSPDFNAGGIGINPATLFINAADWLFLLGACLDATGTWLEMLDCLKQPAALWLLSSLAWLTDALLYLVADSFHLPDEDLNVFDDDDDDGEYGAMDGTLPPKPTTSPRAAVLQGEGRDGNRAMYCLDDDNVMDDEEDGIVLAFHMNQTAQQTPPSQQLDTLADVLVGTTPSTSPTVASVAATTTSTFVMDKNDYDQSESIVTPYVAADDWE
jgi:hypothetical protein